MNFRKISNYAAVLLIACSAAAYSEKPLVSVSDIINNKNQYLAKPVRVIGYRYFVTPGDVHYYKFRKEILCLKPIPLKAGVFRRYDQYKLDDYGCLATFIHVRDYDRLSPAIKKNNGAQVVVEGIYFKNPGIAEKGSDRHKFYHELATELPTAGFIDSVTRIYFWVK